jgi:hypothetical protein
VHFVEHGQTRMRSMMNAIVVAKRRRDYHPGEFVLVVTGDLPLLSPNAIDCFVAACQGREGEDCYVGMVPHTAVAAEMYPLLVREGVEFRGQVCLHTDVYLVRPSAMSKATCDRIDDIMTVRRTGGTTLPGMLKALTLVIRIVGLRGMVPFVRVVASLPHRAAQRRSKACPGPDRLETSVVQLIERGLGLRLCFVRIDEPVLGLGIDYPDDVDRLLAYARALEADTRTT